MQTHSLLVDLFNKHFHAQMKTDLENNPKHINELLRSREVSVYIRSVSFTKIS